MTVPLSGRDPDASGIVADRGLPRVIRSALAALARVANTPRAGGIRGARLRSV